MNQTVKLVDLYNYCLAGITVAENLCSKATNNKEYLIASGYKRALELVLEKFPIEFTDTTE